MENLDGDSVNKRQRKKKWKKYLLSQSWYTTRAYGGSFLFNDRLVSLDLLEKVEALNSLAANMKDIVNFKLEL